MKLYNLFFFFFCRKSETYDRPTTYIKPVFRLFTYYWAAKRGAAGEDCQEKYPICPAITSDVINMGTLGLWQTISSFISIKLSDE